MATRIHPATETTPRQRAVGWACQSIAKWAPHLELRATDKGWSIWWRPTEADPEAIPMEDAQDLDWVGLVGFARRLTRDL